MRKTLVLLALVVAVVIGLLYALQRQLIYFPDGSAPRPPDGTDEVRLSTSDGLTLTAWFLPPRGPDSGLAVLVAPGNGGNRAGRHDLGVHLSRRGFGVLLLDYRGYGGNPGDPSEDGLAHDAEAAVEALEELGYPPERTIYFGESLGSGVVARLARTHEPAGIVLRSPFTSLSDVGAHHYPWLPVRLMLREKYPVVEHVREIGAPVVVVYGDADSVIPPDLSRTVARETRNLADEVVLRGTDHNDSVMFGSRMAEIVAALVD